MTVYLTCVFLATALYFLRFAFLEPTNPDCVDDSCISAWEWWVILGITIGLPLTICQLLVAIPAVALLKRTRLPGPLSGLVAYLAVIGPVLVITVVIRLLWVAV